MKAELVELILTYCTPSDSVQDEYLCYILESVDGMRTYAGITNNMTRRLRQHNGTLAGGAKYTSKPGSRPWKIVLTVHGFKTKTQVLQFEWALHHMKGKGGVRGRMEKLMKLLRKHQWTRSAPLACTVPLTLHIPGQCSPPGLVASKLPEHIETEFIGMQTD